MSSGDQIDFVDAVRVGKRSFALWRDLGAPLLVVEDLKSGRCRRISLPFPFRVERYTAATMGDRYVGVEISAREVVGFCVLDTRSMAPALVVERAAGRLLTGNDGSLWQYCPGQGLYRVRQARNRLRRYLFAPEQLVRNGAGEVDVRRGCASPAGATLLLSDGGVVQVSTDASTPRRIGEVGRRLPDVRCVARVGDHLVYVTVDALGSLRALNLATGEERLVEVPFEVGMIRALGIGEQLAIWSLGAAHAEVWDARDGSWVGNGVGVPVGV